MTSCEDAASHAAADASMSAVEQRIVLVGRTGTGRSSSGNTLLGRSAFRADVSPGSVTPRCMRQTGTVEGRRVTVMDTPGFLHTQLSPQEVAAEIGRGLALCSPGPHALVVTLQLGRFTQEERDALEWIKATLGPEASRFTVVLFTWGDQLKDKRIEDFLAESDELSEFVQSCRGGCHVFDNTARATSQQVTHLLDKVDKMVVDNGGGCYSDEMFKEAERAIREAQRRIVGGGEPPLSEERRSSSREEEEARRRAERLFWCELLTALGRGAAEGAGLVGKDKEKGKAVKKVKVVERAAALAASPLSVSSAAKAVGGAVREGGKVFYKHRKTFLP